MEKGKIISILVILAVVCVAGWQILEYNSRLAEKGVLLAEKKTVTPENQENEKNTSTSPMVTSSAPAIDSSQRTSLLAISSTSQENIVASVATTEKATLTINNGLQGQNFSVEVQEGETAFSLLQKAVAMAGLEVKTKDYGSMGILVEQIGAQKNGQDGKYWLYYLNNEMATVAVNKQGVKAGDKVEFRFEKTSF